MEWRKKWGADDIKNWKAPETVEKYYPSGICGRDKDGAPGTYTGWVLSLKKFKFVLKVITKPLRKKALSEYAIKPLKKVELVSTLTSAKRPVEL